MVSFYPMTFKPIYKPKMWGGRRFATLFNRELPANDSIGESWEISDRKDGVSIIDSGEFAGMSLNDFRQKYAESLFGEQVDKYKDRFPLLLKFLNAEEKLSLQVHPDDKYAMKNENDLGKNEAWFVVDAMPDSEIVRGFKAGITKDKAKKAIEKGKIESILYSFNVDNGDAISIPTGTVHGIGSGLVLAEIQQNSDVTYRLHDYNRTDKNGRKRELHIEKALDVLSFRDIGLPKVKPVQVEPLHYRLSVNDHFSFYYYNFREPIHEYSINRFRMLCNVQGHGTIISPEGLFEDVDFHPGTSILIPAAVKDFSLVPATHCVMLDIIPGKYMIRKKKRKFLDE